MAYIVSTSQNIIDAHNSTHAQIHGTGSKHNDGADYLVNGTHQVITGSSPTDLAGAISVFTQAKDLFNNYHINRGGSNIYAHLIVDSVNTVTANISDVAFYTSAIFSSLQIMTDALQVSYTAHIANLKPDTTASGVHVVADTTNILSGILPLTSFGVISAVLNEIKLNANNHFLFSVMASPHLIPDVTNTILTANCTATDYDSMINLANDIKITLNAHYTQMGVHAVNDTFNTITVPDITDPAGLYDLAVQYKTKHNAHVGSAVFHNAADAGNALTYSGPSTILDLVIAAAEVYTKQPAHFNAAPVSQAMRSV